MDESVGFPWLQKHTKNAKAWFTLNVWHREEVNKIETVIGLPIIEKTSFARVARAIAGVGSDLLSTISSGVDIVPA